MKPQQLEYVLDTLRQVYEGDAGIKMVDVLHSAFQMVKEDPGASRLFVEQLAYTAAGIELQRLGLNQLAAAFIETPIGWSLAQQLWHVGTSF